MSQNYDVALAILDGLASHRVTDLVLCPGSRNTPLMVAAMAHPNFTLHSVIDERSAGFFALGLSKAGRRAAVVTTSGTAVANLLPAVMEAERSFTPLAVVTADRPPHLRRRGANQTVDQLGIFGVHVRVACDVQNVEVLAEVLPRIIDGPIHINVPFDKPLEPDADDAERLANVGRVKITPLAKPSPIRFSGRGIVLAGPGSNLSGPGVVGDGLAKQPGLSELVLARASKAAWILQDGQSPAHPDIRAWLAKHRDVPRHRFGRGEDEWGEPQWLAPGTPVELALDEDWVAELSRASKAARDAVAGALCEDAGSEPSILAAVAAQAECLVVGNSLPARDAALSVSQGRVFCTRGASGIDGVVSFACGVAEAAGSAVCVLGDVSFQHDVGGLAQAVGRNVTFVVIDNGGGAIFDQLPIAKTGVDMAHWQTPPQLDPVKAAAAFGLASRRVTADELVEALASTAQVLVVTTDPASSATLRKAARDAGQAAAAASW